jgi:CRISPR-associated endonuclease Cas1
MLDVRQWNDANPDESLVLADGPSVTVNLYDGMLVIKDGPKNDERERRFAKVPRVMRHLVILSPHGYISTDAQRWLADTGVTWVITDRSGGVPRTLAMSQGQVNVKLLRAQAFAGKGGPLEYVGVEIVRGFRIAKLTGQAANCEHLGKPDAAKEIRRSLDAISIAGDIRVIQGLEGSAASYYWRAWKGTSVEWAFPKPMQPHWREYPGRPNLRYTHTHGANQAATDPVNACLNYGYHVAETECVLALSAAGLSPELGIDHTDRVGRASFALDLLEVFRPEVDRIVLDLISEPLVKVWFREDSGGTVRIASPLTHRLSSAVHGAATCLLPHIRHTVTTLTNPDIKG